jgi:hypothetical protein
LAEKFAELGRSVLRPYKFCRVSVGFGEASRMLRPEQLTRVVIELIFVLLGGLVVWLGLTNQILPDPTKPTWMILAFALIAWGVYAFARPARVWLRGERWTRGVSLILLGILMLGIARAPFAMIGKLLALAGVILVLRGLVGTVLILRQR